MLVPATDAITLYLNADWSLPIQWFDGPGETNPHDITGHTIEAGIATAPGAPPLLAFTVTIVNASLGKWTVGLTRAQLTLGSTVLNYKRGYVWDMFVKYPSLLVDKLIDGGGVTIKAPAVTVT